MFSNFFIHYIGFAFLGYVYQHFENRIILKNYICSFFFPPMFFLKNLNGYNCLCKCNQNCTLVVFCLDEGGV